MVTRIKWFFVEYFTSMKNLFSIRNISSTYLKGFVVAFGIALFFTLPFYILAFNSIFFSFTIPLSQIFYFIGLNIFNSVATIVFVDIIKDKAEEDKKINKIVVLSMHIIISLIFTMFFAYYISLVLNAI